MLDNLAKLNWLCKPYFKFKDIYPLSFCHSGLSVWVCTCYTNIYIQYRHSLSSKVMELGRLYRFLEQSKELEFIIIHKEVLSDINISVHTMWNLALYVTDKCKVYDITLLNVHLTVNRFLFTFSTSSCQPVLLYTCTSACSWLDEAFLVTSSICIPNMKIADSTVAPTLVELLYQTASSFMVLEDKVCVNNCMLGTISEHWGVLQMGLAGCSNSLWHFPSFQPQLYSLSNIIFLLPWGVLI